VATLVLGAYLASQKKGRDVRRKGDIAQLAKALEMYNSDRGRYPASNNGLIVGCGDTATLTDCNWGQAWNLTINGGETVTYEIQLPQDPQYLNDNTKKYYYDSDANGTYYQIYGLLENSDDTVALTKNAGGVVQTFTGTKCNSNNDSCNYGIASTNKLPTDNGHDKIPH
jgi:type II secretory pathway pseudopilin PulG